MIGFARKNSLFAAGSSLLLFFRLFSGVDDYLAVGVGTDGAGGDAFDLLYLGVDYAARSFA